MSIYEMSLDLKKSSPIYSDPIVLRQGDTNVEILVHVFDNSTPKNLENLPIEFHADKPDATTIDDDEQSHFKIGNDKESFTYTVPDELTDASGSTTNTYFKVGSDSTSNFYIHILTKAGMEKLESGDYISKVDRIFNHVMSDYSAINDLAETGKGTFDTALADSKKEIKDLMDNLNAEYVQFINSKTTDFNTFLTNLDSQATDVKNKYTALKAQLDALEVPVNAVGTNLLKNTGNLSSTSTTNVWNTLFDSSQVYDSGIKSLSGVSAMTFSFDVYIPLNAKAGDAVPINLKGQNSQATNAGADDWNTLMGVSDYVIEQNDLGKTIRASCPIAQDTKYQSFDAALADTVSITIRQRSNMPGFVYSKIKLEKGSLATDWCPNPSEILTQSDYAKIKAAIVALGGALS